MSDRPRIITANTFAQALIDAGVIRAEDHIRRVVIDAGPDPTGAVKIYVERFGDDRLLKVTQTLEGIEISQE